MRLPNSILRVPVLTVALTLCFGSFAWAQRPHPEATKPPAHPPNNKGKPGKGPGPGAKNGSPIVEFLRMSPQQREKALKNLPPERRRNIEDRLARYDAAPPEQKARLERLWSLPPERQQHIRQSMQEVRDMPIERRRPMNQQIRRLQGMTPAEREEYFNSAEFHNRFTPREQEMMRDLSEILPPDGF